MTTYGVRLAHHPDTVAATPPPHRQVLGNLLTISTDPATSGVAVVHAAGELDISTAPRFEHEAWQAVEAGAHGLVVEMRQLSFLSVAALTVLFRLADTPHLACRLVAATRIVFRVLEIGDPNGRLQLVDDVPIAVRQCTTAHALAVAYGYAS
ncbi:MAG: STAS domain-containing protein [Nocardioidaceae bacterium]